MKHVALPILLFCLIACGCSDTPVSSVQGVINTHCPIMKERIDPELTVEWKGKEVGFCCPPCLDEWKEMNDEEREAALKEAATKADDAPEPHAGSGVL